MRSSPVEQHYDDKAEQEWDRLERHRTEFAITMRTLADYLPRPPARILDVGGGPGRYAIALAGQGYAVTLFDLSDRCLELAKAKAAEARAELSGYIHGNALDLETLADDTFDAVLLMGPLYHLLSAGERQTALGEARRVLKREGLIFASFITRYAPLRQAAKGQPEWIIAKRDVCDMLLETGTVLAGPRNGFTASYFAHPTEIDPLMEQGGFETVDLVASEGFVALIEDAVNALTGEAWEAWFELNYRLARDPSIHGAADHLLYVGRKGLR